MNFDIDRSTEVLSATPASLRSLLGNLSDDWTGSQNPKSKIQDDMWSPYDVIGHLIHGEETDWIPRARIILAQSDDRTFVPIDRFAQFENSKGKSLTQLLDEFAKLRSDNLDVLRSWNLDEEKLDLEGMHPELGKVTLRQLLATWVVHDLSHIAQITRTMARAYTTAVGPWTAYFRVLQRNEQ